MSDKIEYSDIFEQGFDAQAVKAVENIVSAFKRLEAQQLENVEATRKILDGLKVGGSFKDLQSLLETMIKLTKALKDYERAQKGAAQGEIELQKAEQARLKTEQEKEKLKQQQIRTEQAANKTKEKTLTLYQQESKLLNDLRNKYKDVALAQGENSKAARALIAQITPLDAKLKAIDANVGQFQRNVGNYASGLRSFAGSVNNILGAAGIGVGLSQGFDFIKDSIAEFTKSEKVVKDLQFALKNLSGEGSAALETLNNQAESLEQTFGLFESEDISILQKQLVQLGLNSKDVEKLTPKIVDLAAATGKSLPEATDLAIKAINGQTKGLKEVGLNFSDTGSRLENYNILLDKLDKFQGSAALSAETLEGKQQRIAIAWGNIKEAVGEYLVNSGASLLDSFEVLTGKISLADFSLRQFQETFQKAAKNIADKGPEYTRNALQQLEVQRDNLKKLRDQGEIDNEEYLDRLKFISAEQKALIAEIKKNSDALKPPQKSFKDNDSTSGGVKTEKDVFQNGTYDEAILEQDRLLKEEQEKLDYEYDKDKKERIAKQNKEEYEQAIKLQDDLAKLSEKEEAERERKEKERQEKRLKDAIDFAQKSLQILEKQLKVEADKKEKALNDEVERREKSVDRQRELADKGLANTLAFEEQALKEAEAKREQQEKQRIKQEKTIAFFKLLAANAEKNPQDALQKTIAETLLATAVAGSFYVGSEKVEDSLKGNKVHNGKDGYIVAVDGKERIMTGEQNQLIGDLSNEELAAIAHDYNTGKLLPNEAIDFAMPIRSTAESIYASMQYNQLVQMNSRLGSLEDTIRNKPVSQFQVNKFGQIVETRFENGLKKIITYKNRKPRI